MFKVPGLETTLASVAYALASFLSQMQRTRDDRPLAPLSEVCRVTCNAATLRQKGGAMAKSFIGPFERSVLKALDLQRAERARRREICVWLDRVERCTHQAGYTDSGCGSPAYLLVSGSPRCQTHAIHDLIDLLLAKEVKSNGVP